MKSHLDENMSRRLSMALERLEIQVAVLSLAVISSVVSMRISGLMGPVALSNAAKIFWNQAWWVSACEVVGDQWGLLFVGVGSFGVESDVRTDWLSAMVETTTNEAVGVATFVARSWWHTLVIALTASQSSSLPLVRPSLWISLPAVGLS